MRKPLAPTVAVLALLLLVTRVIPILAARPSVVMSPTGSLNRQSEFDKTAAQYEKRATREPSNPESWYTLAKLYSEKVQKDAHLPRDLAKKYVMRGLEVESKALAINPDYYEALSLKDILLRQRAQYEKEPGVRKMLIAEADVYRALAAAARGKK